MTLPNTSLNHASDGRMTKPDRPPQFRPGPQYRPARLHADPQPLHQGPHGDDLGEVQEPPAEPAPGVGE